MILADCLWSDVEATVVCVMFRIAIARGVDDDSQRNCRRSV